MCHRLKPLGEEGWGSIVVSQERDYDVDRVRPRDIKRGEAEATSQQSAFTIAPSGVRSIRVGHNTLLEGEALAPGADAAPRLGECGQAQLNLHSVSKTSHLGLENRTSWDACLKTTRGRLRFVLGSRDVLYLSRRLQSSRCRTAGRRLRNVAFWVNESFAKAELSASESGLKLQSTNNEYR